VPHTGTQEHSNAQSLPAHCPSQKSKSNIHTDIQTHSAAATHTTTLHTQHARRHGSNTRRPHGMAHPPTTASSSVQRGHSARTQRLQHGVAVAVGSYTTAVRHYDCDMHDHTTRVAVVRSTDCQRSPPPPPPTTHAQQPRTATPRFRARARSEPRRTNTSSPPLKRCHAALHRNTAATAKRGASTHTQRHKAAIAILWYSALPTALETATAMRASYVASMTQPPFFTFSQAQMHTSRTCLLAPRSPTPSHHTHARRHTRRDKPHPAQRHVSVMARVTQNSARLQATHATSHTRTQHTNTQPPHANTTSCTAATTAHCAVITACIPPRARHTQHGTQLQPPHTSPTENHTQSHTRPPRTTHVRAVRLRSVDGMLPESWL
jgi:hypothetical protein